jgi:hypothetical protein
MTGKLNPQKAFFQGKLKIQVTYSFKYPGANPTIASYNASVVNFYNAMGSLARFENKNIIFYF